MMRPIVFLAAACLSAGAHAVEFNQVVVERSQATFVYKQMGVASDGRFRKFAAQIAFDPARPEAGRAQIDMNLASIDTGSAEGDEEVRSKGWFNVAQFPTARFVSSAVKPMGANRYEIAGKLTIKGTTRDIVLPVTFSAKGNDGQFDGAFVIKRLDYKIGEGIWSDLDTVANEVQVKFRIAVAAAAAKK